MSVDIPFNKRSPMEHERDLATSDLHPDVDVALEYARRWRKGIPSDRWCDGHAGAVQVAKGIERMAATILRQIAENDARARASMDASADPMRD